MIFLLVDDDPGKAEAMRSVLSALCVRAEDIVVATDAAQARKYLGENAFDAMLIDVLLPARSGAQPSGTTSVELLRQIIDDGTSALPNTS